MFWKRLLQLSCFGGFPLLLWLAHCVPEENCPHHFRRGPGRVCLKQCLPGAASACLPCFVCNNDGTECVSSSEPCIDGGSIDGGRDGKPDGPPDNNLDGAPETPPAPLHDSNAD